MELKKGKTMKTLLKWLIKKFVTKAALKAQLGWTDEKVESVLATCILEN